MIVNLSRVETAPINSSCVYAHLESTFTWNKIVKLMQIQNCSINVSFVYLKDVTSDKLCSQVLPT